MKSLTCWAPVAVLPLGDSSSSAAGPAARSSRSAARVPPTAPLPVDDESSPTPAASAAAQTIQSDSTNHSPDDDVTRSIIHLPPAHHFHRPSRIRLIIPGSKLTFSANPYPLFIYYKTYTEYKKVKEKKYKKRTHIKNTEKLKIKYTNSYKTYKKTLSLLKLTRLQFQTQATAGPDFICWTAFTFSFSFSSLFLFSWCFTFVSAVDYKAGLTTSFRVHVDVLLFIYLFIYLFSDCNLQH